MSFQSWDTRIDDDTALLSETLEEVLRSSGDPADQKYIELKARAEQALHEVKTASAMRLIPTTTVPKKRCTVPMITCMKNRGRVLGWVLPWGWCWGCC